MLTNLQSAINAVCAEKNLDPQIIYEAIEAALVAAYKREYGDREMDIRVKFDPQSGQSTVYRVFKVVKTAKDIDSELGGEFTQIPLIQAKKRKKNAKVGDEITEDVTPMDYGRIAAQSAKQVIIQKLRSAENEMIAKFYKDKVGEVMPALVKRIIDNGDIEVEVERTTAILFRSKLIPGERARIGSRIKVYVEDIKDSPKGPQVILSRIHPNLVLRLLQLEIPEVAENKVEIRAIAREPGVRTKVAVSSNDDAIDPVGSCVGQKGVRIQGVMDEINNEYVDMIEWTEDREEMLKRSLAPAKITGIRINDKEKPPRAKVYLEEDQRSLAIGRSGQNVRLAGILTQMEIDVLNIPDWEKVLEKEGKSK
ncbi:MAG: transcription termination factor NusA [Patescibacteria group bacterium]|nr:transcription termination factor NusA [Patescibacteria group bacterium]